MALTSRIVASIYGKDGYDISGGTGTVTGRLNYFANNGNTFYAANPGTVYMGVTCNSVIEVFPTGLVTNSSKYYAVQTVAELVSGGI